MNKYSRIIPNFIRDISHDRRTDLFVKLMNPQNKHMIIDLGGGWIGEGGFLMKIMKRRKAKYIIADISNYHSNNALKQGIKRISLYENKLCHFKDKEIDIKLYNSVIEHITLPNDIVI